MRLRNQSRLRLDPLEDRCTPTAGLGDAGQTLLPITQAGGHDQDVLQESPSAASGHGIGLNLARELTRLHGGELRLVRSENDWTEFEVRFSAANGVNAVT